jgi:hypothetical protein
MFKCCYSTSVVDSVVIPTVIVPTSEKLEVRTPVESDPIQISIPEPTVPQVSKQTIVPKNPEMSNLKLAPKKLFKLGHLLVDKKLINLDNLIKLSIFLYKESNIKNKLYILLSNEGFLLA